MARLYRPTAARPSETRPSSRASTSNSGAPASPGLMAVVMMARSSMYSQKASKGPTAETWPVVAFRSRSGATATPAPRRSCPRIVEDGCSAGISLRRNTTAGVASRGMVSSASIGSVGARIIRPVGWALLGAIGDEAALEVVGGDADGDAVATDHADPVLAHLAVEAGEHLVVLAALHLVVAAGQ